MTYLLLAAAFVALLALLLLLAHYAPVGYEDDAGFHVTPNMRYSDEPRCDVTGLRLTWVELFERQSG